MIKLFALLGLPNLPEDVSEEDLDNLTNVARLIQLPYLETICNNLKNEEEFLNPSIGTYLNDETGKRMKELFFNQSTLSDISFSIQGELYHCIYLITYAKDVGWGEWGASAECID